MCVCEGIDSDFVYFECYVVIYIYMYDVFCVCVIVEWKGKLIL